MHLSRLLSIILLFACIQGSFAAAAGNASQGEALSKQIQQLKENVLDINSQLRILEQQLLYPSSQTAFFLSVDAGSPIRLVDVNISLDGKHVAYHFYTRQEYDALSKGGIERLFNDNVKSGRHVLKATITAYNPRGKNITKSANYQFSKGPSRKYIELHVKENVNSMQPSIEFREWNK